jgi:hypothetical protein
MEHQFPFSPRAISYEFVGQAAIAAFVLVASSVGANAETTHYSLGGASGEVFGIANDVCSYSHVFITVAEHGTILDNDANNVAYAFIYHADWCRHISTAAYGHAQNIEFSAVSSADGRPVPESVSASGQIPLRVYSTATGNSTDTLTFQLTLSLAGPVTEYRDFSPSSYQVGGPTIRYARDYGDASVSSSLSTNTLGPLPSVSQAQIGETKSPAEARRDAGSEMSTTERPVAADGGAYVGAHGR